MSTGRKKKIDVEEIKPEVVNPNAQPQIIRVGTEEFMEICHRVHGMLLSRSDRAKKKSDLKPSDDNHEKYIETAKEVFVFVHLMELVENMTEEIADLRQIVSGLGEEEIIEQKPSRHMPALFGTPKKTYLN